MLRRKYLFPHVIELNYQAGRRLGVNVYLLDAIDADPARRAAAIASLPPP